MKNPMVLEVGSRAFFNGKVFSIVGSQGPNWILLDDQELVTTTGARVAIGTGLVVHKVRCEPVAWDVFKIGDAVQSKHSFKGAVTGFEEETNRVVCISDAIDKYDNDRTRYAYKVTEVQHKPNTFEFILNKVYQVRLGGRHASLRAIEHMYHDDMFTLLDASTGKIFGHTPKVAKLSDLEENLDIRKIS